MITSYVVVALACDVCGLAEKYQGRDEGSAVRKAKQAGWTLERKPGLDIVRCPAHPVRSSRRFRMFEDAEAGSPVWRTECGEVLERPW